MSLHKFIVEVIYSLDQEYCEVYQRPRFDFEDYQIISLDNGMSDPSESFHNSWEEWVHETNENLVWELGKVYKTVLEVTETYHTDYYGEVDVDTNVKVLWTGLYCEPQPDKVFDKWITLKENL